MANIAKIYRFTKVMSPECPPAVVSSTELLVKRYEKNLRKYSFSYWLHNQEER
jgi:hypothetical protein